VVQVESGATPFVEASPAAVVAEPSTVSSIDEPVGQVPIATDEPANDSDVVIASSDVQDEQSQETEPTSVEGQAQDTEQLVEVAQEIVPAFVVTVAPTTTSEQQECPVVPQQQHEFIAPIVVAATITDQENASPIMSPKRNDIASPFKVNVPVLAFSSPNAKTQPKTNPAKRPANGAVTIGAAEKKKNVAFDVARTAAPVSAATKRKDRVRKAAGKHFGNVQHEVLLASIAAFERQLTHRTSLDAHLNS